MWPPIAGKSKVHRLSPQLCDRLVRPALVNRQMSKPTTFAGVIEHGMAFDDKSDRQIAAGKSSNVTKPKLCHDASTDVLIGRYLAR